MENGNVATGEVDEILSMVLAVYEPGLYDNSYEVTALRMQISKLENTLLGKLDKVDVMASQINEVHAVQTGEFFKLIAKQNTPAPLTAKQKKKAEEKAKAIELEMKIEELRTRKFNKILNKPEDL